jgi:hypothetical protein
VFDFLDSDWFVIGLEVVFIILISYDVKKYFETQKKEYIVNIVLTLGFAIWTLLPFYTSYFGWQTAQKTEMLKVCKDANNTELCNCIDESIFKEYTNEEYLKLDKSASTFKEFLKETQEECLDDSWF